MLRLVGVAGCVVLCLAAGCGTDPDFAPPARPDMRVDRDLSSSFVPANSDMTCFNLQCGGCSTWANPDGTPAKVGDPCLWKGSWQCMGTTLTCSDSGCPTCGGTMSGTVCGADGHTILELTGGKMCRAYDFGAVIDVCNHGASDHCVGRCVKTGTQYDCAARCTSDDGGATGCAHQATDTCESLAGC